MHPWDCPKPSSPLLNVKKIRLVEKTGPVSICSMNSHRTQNWAKRSSPKSIVYWVLPMGRSGATPDLYRHHCSPCSRWPGKGTSIIPFYRYSKWGSELCNKLQVTPWRGSCRDTQGLKQGNFTPHLGQFTNYLNIYRTDQNHELMT